MKPTTKTLRWFRSLVVILGLTLSITGPLRPVPTAADLALHAYVMSGGNPNDLCSDSQSSHLHLNCILFCTVFPLTLEPTQPDAPVNGLLWVATLLWPETDPADPYLYKHKPQARAPPRSA